MISQATVRIRKFTKNGTITKPRSKPRHLAVTRVASQYANGNPISRQRTVPTIEIWSVWEKTWRNDPDRPSLYRSRDS